MDEFARLGYTLDGDSVSSISGIACVEIEASLLVGADCDAWIPVDGLAQVGTLANATIASVIAWSIEFSRTLIAKWCKRFDCIIGASFS